MKFDVIVGNPPYQLNDGGAGSSASPIYHRFVQTAKALEPKHIVMITPSRWMAGGKGLDDFRTEMLEDRRIREIVDFHDAAALFPGINVNGGVSYFHWEAEYDGPCRFTAVHKTGRRSTMDRKLDEHDILVRLNDALPILEKVQAAKCSSFSHWVSSRKPFGFDTLFRGRKPPIPSDGVPLAGMPGWVDRDEIKVNVDWIDQWKVLIPRATDGNEIYPLPVLTPPVVSGPGTACNERYLVVGPFGSDKARAENCAAYMRTRFFRFMLNLRKPTQDNRADRFTFVPDLPLDQAWTDETLYARFGIIEEEQEYISEIIRDAPQ